MERQADGLHHLEGPASQRGRDKENLWGKNGNVRYRAKRNRSGRLSKGNLSVKLIVGANEGAHA
jgi:hypothetical protein